MFTQYRKIIAEVLAVVLSVGLLATPVFADENSIHMITGIGEFDINENALEFDAEYRPSLDELVDIMPDTLEVYLDGKNELESVNVNWFCMSEDYEKAEYYYYQFVPTWNEDEYILSEGIELPYIAVFFRPTNGGISTYAVTSNSNETIIYNFLRNELGLNIAAACGVLANIYHESAFNPAAYNGNDTGGTVSYGICQWNNGAASGNRYGLLQSWCASNGYDYRTLEGQLNYMKYELQSTPYYKLSTLQSNIANTADGAYEASLLWSKYYEGCAQAYYETRANLAKNTYWPSYGSSSGSGNTVTSTTTPMNPEGCLDSVVGGKGTITVRGWAFDRNSVETALEIHVYVGGTYNDGKAVYGTQIKADQYRPDVNNAYGTGAYHGFDSTISVPVTGTYPIYVYAINVGGSVGTGYNTLLGTQTVTISNADTTAPVISNIVIEPDADGYTVTCDVSDESGIQKVLFPTWTPVNGQDDLLGADGSWPALDFHKGTVSNGKASFRVNRSDHNNEYGSYVTHIYAYDAYGNVSRAATEYEFIKTIFEIANVETVVDDNGYTVVCTVSDDTNVAHVTFKTYAEENDYMAGGAPENICQDAAIDNGKFTCRVNISEHSYKTGKYITSLAYDDPYAGTSSYNTIAEIEFIDTTAPKVMNPRVSEVTKNGFTITCDIYDNVGVVGVKFIVGDELKEYVAIIDGNTASCFIPFSDHGYKMNCEYLFSSYVYDAANNSYLDHTEYMLRVDSVYGDMNFEDVNATDWFYDVVYYNYVAGFMTGKSQTIFAPDDTLTRAEFASVLHRTDGESEVEYEAVFSDIAESDWYAAPIIWASQKGVVNGFADGTFGPDKEVTREQMAIMMHNYATAQGYNTNQKGDLSKFEDVEEVSWYAVKAMQWAVGTGVISGKNGVSLAPQGNATRAECAAIIQRFMENCTE